MKKHLVKIIILLFFTIVGFLGYAVVGKVNDKNSLKERVQTIPKFSLQKVSGETFTKKNLKRGKSTVFIYFNSECEYCQMKAEGISKIIEQFNQNDTQFLFISSEPVNTIKTFANTYKLSNYDNIYFLHDPKATFANELKINSFPFSLIYNRQQKLITKHKGYVKAQTLLEEVTISELLK